ncbi:MAG: twin-arginine translocase TatA/TatE family subunit [Nitrospirae bacterium]|nr:twin-arginine translocase TatA/TatE family subunit [Nitrospirota bacterium]
MFGLGMWELIIILLVILIIFGAGKLPEIGKGLGKAIKGFKESVKEEEKGLEDTKKIDEKKDK